MRPDPYAWDFHPVPLAFAVGLLLVYVLVAESHKVRPGRVVVFTAGLALLVATVVTPLHGLQYHLLVMHLLQNVVLAEWAPALLVIGLPPAFARRVRIPAAAALPFWLVIYFTWHVPAIYDAALRHEALLHLEHVSYVLAGAVFWWPVVHGELRDVLKAMYVFAAFVLASPVGLLLALLPDPIYSYYEHAPSHLWGLDPLEDQQLAGLTMAGEQSIVFFAVFSYYFARFMASEPD